MGEIVVGVDGSESSDRALRWALDEARLRAETGVVVVHAYRPPEVRQAYAYPHSYPYMSAGAVTTIATRERERRDEQEQVARRQAEAVVDRAIHDAGGADGLAIRRVIVAREPSKVLVEMSGTADLLVVGSRGRGGFRGLLLGSVSLHTAHHSSCPVVVIR